MKITIDIQEIVWQCGDCQNVYDITIRECPNKFVHLARGKK